VPKAVLVSDKVENVNQTERKEIMLDDWKIGGQLRRYSAKQNLHRINFFCDALNAQQVSLVGDFNHWNPRTNPMVRQPDGRWVATVELSHGYHEYFFLVDGEPVLDPNASGKTQNALNQPVSLVAVS